MASPRREAQKQRSRQAKAARLAAQRRRRNIKIVSIIVAAALAFTIGGAFLSTSDNDSDTDTATGEIATTEPGNPTPVPAGRTITGDTPCPPVEGEVERASSFEKSPPLCIDPAKRYTAEFTTTEGRIVVNLDTQRTPQTTNNFVVLSRYGYYDGSAIFRTDPSLEIIQGGGPNTQTNSDPGPGYTIADEGSGFTYAEGDLVMARTSEPNSASAQFFFATGPKVSVLNGQGTYVTFGKVAEGLDVVKAIIGLHGGPPEESGAPSKPVIVNDVVIREV